MKTKIYSFCQLKLVVYSLIIAIIFGIGCSSTCNNQKDDNLIIKGTIKSEKFVRGTGLIPPSNSYFFTLLTEDGLKNFECWGNGVASKFDVLLNPGDNVTIKILESKRKKKTDFVVNLNSILEINGVPFSN